jgi:hypothetical protein
MFWSHFLLENTREWELHAIVIGKMVRKCKGDEIYELCTLVVSMVLDVCGTQRQKSNTA